MSYILSIKVSVAGNNKDEGDFHEGPITAGQKHAPHSHCLTFIYSCTETTWIPMHMSFTYHSEHYWCTTHISFPTIDFLFSVTHCTHPPVTVYKEADVYKEEALAGK